jgi:cell division protein FtsI (penicillin-binding protein 3)
VSLVRLDQPNDGQQIISEETATAIRDMMEEVVRPGGIGSEAGVYGYRIAGKTGTSWKFAAGGYSEDKYFSIFAGLAPASDPRLAAVIVINEPTGDKYYGGEVAAPVFSDVMTESLRLLAIAPDALPAAPSGSLVQAMSQ